VEGTSSDGQLVVVATPLGNLGDLSPRARALLRDADAIYCEDTRRTRVMLSANGLPGAGRLSSLREHNEAAQAERVVQRVRAGELVVLVSDAGTPGISDPGSRTVATVVAAGLSVTTAPGPSALIAALSISGLDTERFVMEGFIPRKAGDRARLFADWADEERTVVFYESPKRVGATLGELASLFPDRRIVVARELTKVHEEVLRGTLTEVASRLRSREVLGEIVVVLEGATLQVEFDDELVRSALAARFVAGVSTRDAVDDVASELGIARRDVYRLALDVRKGETA
jgi:16S rRNA (cytidine1402-2'-O)-methyltransferase